MTKSLTLPPDGFDELAPDEQLEYLGSLWDRIAASPEQVVTPDWHRDVIRQRRETHRKDPAAVQPWAEVRAEIEKSLRRK